MKSRRTKELAGISGGNDHSLATAPPCLNGTKRLDDRSEMGKREWTRCCGSRLQTGHTYRHQVIWTSFLYDKNPLHKAYPMSPFSLLVPTERSVYSSALQPRYQRHRSIQEAVEQQDRVSSQPIRINPGRKPKNGRTTTKERLLKVRIRVDEGSLRRRPSVFRIKMERNQMHGRKRLQSQIFLCWPRKCSKAFGTGFFVSSHLIPFEGAFSPEGDSPFHMDLQLSNHVFRAISAYAPLSANRKSAYKDEPSFHKKS